MRAVPALVVVTTVFLVASVPAPTVATQDVEVTFAVVDLDGDPVDGATVLARWNGGSDERTTLSNGEVSFDVPSGARVSLTVEHPDFTRNDPYVARNVTGGAYTVEVRPAGRLRVVTTDQTGTIDDARVTVTGNGTVVAEGTTSASGAFSTGQVERGSYRIDVVAPGHRNVSRTVNVTGTNTTEIRLETLQVQLTVVVRDPRFDPPRPIEDVIVETDRLGNGVTDADGRVRFGVAANTQVRFRTVRRNYRAIEQTVYVGGTSRRVRVNASRMPILGLSVPERQVTAGETLTVRVTDAYGRSATNVTVRLDDRAVGRTDADGRLDVTFPTPGRYTVVGKRNGTTSNTETVIVEASAETTTTEPETATTTTTVETTETTVETTETTETTTTTTVETTEATVETTEATTVDTVTQNVPTSTSEGDGDGPDDVAVITLFLVGVVLVFVIVGVVAFRRN